MVFLFSRSSPAAPLPVGDSRLAAGDAADGRSGWLVARGCPRRVARTSGEVGRRRCWLAHLTLPEGERSPDRGRPLAALPIEVRPVEIIGLEAPHQLGVCCADVGLVGPSRPGQPSVSRPSRSFGNTAAVPGLPRLLMTEDPAGRSPSPHQLARMQHRKEPEDVSF